jgi:hypothetical protein
LGNITNPITGTSATNVSITNFAHDVVIGQLSAGNLTLGVTSGTITQSPGTNLTVSGTANLVATGNVILANSTNDFATVTACGTNISVNDLNNITIGAITATGDFTVQGDNTTTCISVTGPIVATGGLGNVSLTGRNIVVTGNISSDAGNITLRGNNGTYQTGTFHGVEINGVNVNTTGGSIVIDGRGADSLYGVNLNAANLSTGGTGSVNILGISGNEISSDKYGIYSAFSNITTSNGSIDFNGTSCGSLDLGCGVQLLSTNLSAGGTGHINIIGVANEASNATGIDIQTSILTTNNGTITANGISYGTSDGDTGVRISAGSVLTANGTGAIDIRGTSGNGSSGNELGIQINTTSLTTANGTIQLIGISHGTGTGDTGACLVSVNILANGTGSVSIMALSGDGSGNNEFGVYGSLSNITTENGNLAITGVSRGTGNSATGACLIGVNILANGTGSVSISGQSGNGTGNSTIGVYISTSAESITTTNSTTNVTSNVATDVTTNAPVITSSSITAANGTIQITGVSNGTGINATGACLIGVNILANGTGSVSIYGQSGNGTGDSAIGVYSSPLAMVVSTTTTTTNLTTNTETSNVTSNVLVVIAGSNITTENGALAITGSSRGTGSTDNTGVSLTGSIMTAGGAGTIDITGETANASQLGIDLSEPLGQIWSSGGLITLTANSMNLTGTVNATDSGDVLIRTLGAGINLGGDDSSANLGLTQAELAHVTARVLTIGNATTGNITITSNMTREGNLTLSSNGIITETPTGNLTVKGSAAFITSGSDITLNNETNNFYSTGDITATGGNISIQNSNATVLGTISASNLTVNSTGGNISQASGSNLVVSGNGTFISTGTVLLSNSTNSIGNLSLTAATVDVKISGNQQIGSIQTGNLTFNGTGSVTQDSNANLIVTGTANFSIDGNLTLNNQTNRLSGPIIATGNVISIFNSVGSNLTNVNVGELIIVSESGDIRQSGTVIVRNTNTVYLTAVNGNIIMNNLTNDFVGGIYANASNNIELYNSNTTFLGNIASANFQMVSGGGNISQVPGANVNVSGTSNLVATGNTITLQESTNDFHASGSISATATNITLFNANSTQLGLISANFLTVNSTGPISQADGTNLTINNTANMVSTGNVNLSNSTNRFGTVLASGSDITIVDSNAVDLGTMTATNLTVTAGGMITQSGSANVTGASNLTASTFAITLNQPNNLMGNLTSNGLLAISSGNATTLTAVGGNVSISGGNVTGLTTTSVDLNLTGGTLNGLVVNGNTSNLSGGTFIGNANVTAGNLVSNISLGSLDVQTGGRANLTGGSATVVTVSGGTLIADSTVLTSLAVNSGSATVTLGNITNPITGTSATNVSITNFAHDVVIGQLSAGNLTLGVTSGTITQSPSTNLTVSGTANLVATGNVILANSTNNFATVTACGTNISFNDLNNITIGAITANGDFTVQG